MRIKGLALNGVIALAAAVIGLLLSEVAARFALNPSDFLSVEMVPDEILGAKPSQSTIAGGLDRWGFRNERVPESSDIVAIGDSHTFGNTATMADAWPFVLGELTGRSTYNMGMGGYGPVQYYHLLRTQALTLKPQTVLVGLYIGDDFENAYLISYGLPHWRALRGLPDQQVDFDIWESPPAPSWHKRIRIWLSRNSVIYQLVFHGPLLGRLQGETQIRTNALGSEEVVSLSIPEKNILEAFRPRNVQRILDQEDARIREGMRITFGLLSEMNTLSRDAGAQFIVVVIPTKEMVFAEYLEHQPQLPLHDVLDSLLANERIARAETFAFLRTAGIPYVDTLPALRAAAGGELYARTSTDMHPNRNGYRVIAEATARFMAETDRD